MKLCFIIDGRALHARNWIKHVVNKGHEIHLISTHPCSIDDLPISSLHVVPLDFSARVRAGSGKAEAKTEHGSPLVASLRGTAVWKMLVQLRNKTSPLAVRLQRGKVRRIIGRIAPDLVHAMRLPFEGILAAEAIRDDRTPLVISIWGNDFTLAAANSPTVARLSRRAMERADGLHPDCERDLRLARDYGFGADKPSAVLPGNGGVRTDIFRPGPPDPALRARFRIPEGVPVVINPRGFKAYIRNDSFFHAIPRVLERFPDAIFLGGMMEGNNVAEGYVSELNIADSVRLLPFVTHKEMADIFRLATVLVSPSEHDGTPNTLLEAMASGVFPVAGDIESVREWIDDGVNGLLFDPGDSQSIADATIRALSDTGLRGSAAQYNGRMIAEKVAIEGVIVAAEAFYNRVLDHVANAAASKV